MDPSRYMKDKRAGRLRGQIRPAPCGAQSGSPPRAPSAGPRPTKTAKAPHGCLRPERAEARRGRRRLEGGEQFAMEMSPLSSGNGHRFLRLQPKAGTATGWPKPAPVFAPAAPKAGIAAGWPKPPPGSDRSHRSKAHMSVITVFSLIPRT